MEDCIFCKIVKGQLPSDKIFEDEKFLAFLDIYPVKPGHTLVIPKKHYDDFSRTPNEILAKMMEVIDKVSKAVVKTVEAQGFNLNLNNGSAAGQMVGHTHFHIIPRHTGDGLKLWPGREYKEGQAEDLLKRIKINL